MKWLREYLSLGVTRDAGSASAYRRPMGFQQITLGAQASALTMPTPPANSGLVVGYVVIQCQGALATDFASWRDDGTAPTNTVGMTLFSGQELDYSGDPTMIRFIIGAGSPVLNVSYYA